MSDATTEAAESMSGDNFDLNAPVPVQIVGPLSVKDHQARAIASETFTLANNGDRVRILPANPFRTRALVAGGGTVVIGSETVTPGSGFPVNATPVVLLTTAEVWAVAGAAGASVSVLAEHRDG